jgi:hypothetical protein
MHCFCTYYGAEHFASNFDFALWRKDLPKFNLFAPHPQKRLDNHRFCTYFGARSTSVSHIAFALAPPRRKIRKVKHYFRFFQRVFHVEHFRIRSQAARCASQNRRSAIFCASRISFIVIMIYSIFSSFEFKVSKREIMPLRLSL